MPTVFAGYIIVRTEGKAQTSLFVMVTADGENWPAVLGSSKCGRSQEGVESWKDNISVWGKKIKRE